MQKNELELFLYRTPRPELLNNRLPPLYGLSKVLPVKHRDESRRGESMNLH